MSIWLVGVSVFVVDLLVAFHVVLLLVEISVLCVLHVAHGLVLMHPFVAGTDLVVGWQILFFVQLAGEENTSDSACGVNLNS